MTQHCPCHRHGYHPDVYLRCGGGLCGHPCDRDVREHEPCEWIRCRDVTRHSCGCLPPQEMQAETVALVTSFLTRGSHD